MTAGRLPESILNFARLLRAAGLTLGSGQTIEATRAASLIGVERRDDFYWALVATLVAKIDQKPIFDQAFELFWQNPHLRDRALQLLLPRIDTGAPEPSADRLAQRLSDALAPSDNPATRPPAAELDLTLTWSNDERLKTLDFEQMTAEELAAARLAIQRLRLAFPALPTRRSKPAGRGHAIDARATLRQALKSGGDLMPLRYKASRPRPAPLVALCDISGSMGRYSRILLHFVHALTNDRDRVSAFVFGTRLTNITRALKARDVDVAVEQASSLVSDWSGGTRIGQSLAQFNRDWSRRVLGQGATVLLISDGLDKDGGEGLSAQVERLQKSCRRLIWLNPLLRYDGFEPKSLGIRAILPHVDEFRPVHNLASLGALADALNRPARRTLRNLQEAA
jgi:uncharacterized protein with von Willebrand factor type A (vWA) domain